MQNVNQPFVLPPFCELACMHESRAKIDSTEKYTELAIGRDSTHTCKKFSSNTSIVCPFTLPGLCQPFTSEHILGHCIARAARINLAKDLTLLASQVLGGFSSSGSQYQSFIGHYFNNIYMAKCSEGECCAV